MSKTSSTWHNLSKLLSSLLFIEFPAENVRTLYNFVKVAIVIIVPNIKVNISISQLLCNFN